MYFVPPGGLSKHKIEMVVLQNVGGTQNSDDTVSALYEFLCQVVGKACALRSSVRVGSWLLGPQLLFLPVVLQPNHPGTIVQLGWNAGPRHCRVWGPAVSYKPGKSPDTMLAHDQDILATMSLMWAIVKSYMPQEVVSAIEEVMEATGMPHMATQLVDEGFSPFLKTVSISVDARLWHTGLGYQFSLDGVLYSFPLAERGPAEGYMAHGYTV